MKTRQHSTTLDNTRQHSTTLDNTRLTSIAKAALSKLYVLLTMSALMLNSINLLAQADSIPTYSSFGIFDKVTDRFGQDLSWSDLKINPSTSSSRFILNKGVFEIHFYPGSGLELASDPTHINRRAVIDELFNVANTIWGGQMSNDKVIVRFLPMPQSIAYGQDYPLLASSYYIVPKFTANFSEASDCVIAQYIQSSENPYQTLGDFNTKLQIASNDLQFSHLDFYCNLSNYNINTNLQTATIASNQIDLYSVALRKLLVGLGVNSLLNQTGQSISANAHQFSRWDTQLQFQNQPLIAFNSTQKKYLPAALNSWLSNLPSPTSNCGAFYACAQSPYFTNSTRVLAMSHCYKQGLELNYLNDACSPDPVVLNRSWMSGTVRRKLSSTDLSVLQSLGYSLNGCFGSTANNNDFCAQVSGGSKFTRYTSTTPNQTFLGIIEANSTQKISVNALLVSNPSITSIEYIDHIGGPSVFSLNGDSISVSNFKKGRNILRFLLTNNQGDKMNAFALLALRGGEVCEGGVCNLVTNNGFEELAGNQQCGIIDELAPPLAGWPWVFIDCWSTFSGNPDLHSEDCGDVRFDYADGGAPWDTGGTVPSDPNPNNDNALFLFSRIYDGTWNDGAAPFEEAIQGPLVEALTPGVTYEISLRYFRRDGGNPHLRIYFTDEESITDISQIIDPAALGLVVGPDLQIQPISPNAWQTWNVTFTAPANQPGLNRIIIANEATFLSSNDDETLLGKLFIDNLQIRPINATFNIPQSFTCTGSTIGSLQNFASPAGGVVSGAGVTGSGPFTFSATSAGVGTHTLTYTVIVNGCTLTATDVITVGELPTATATPSIELCSSSGCNNSILVTTNSTNNTISWVGNVSGFNPTNLCPGSYTATVTSPQGCSVQVPVTINFTAGPNLTVSNTQTVNMNVQDYNSITVQSGGYLSINTTGANTGTIGSMILVQNGGRLKISANLRFLPSAMIRVEQGGRVYIEGGSLSAHCPNTFWHGIEVLGTPNNTHDAVAQSITNFFTQDTDGNNGQGGLRIDKGAIIERAVIGVRLFTGNLNAFSQNATSSGGYIWANEMTFRNNTRDLVTSTLNAENQSRLSRVTFEVNSASLNTASNIGPRVLLNHTRGIKFEGCTWSNTNVNLLNGNASNIFNMTGLSLFRSSCIVTEHITPTVKYPNAFNGFVYGIQNRGQCPDDMVVEFTEFRCYRGIYATLWADISTVRNCRFQNLNTAPSITIEIPPSFVNVNGIWSNFTQ
ncbi:MAG: hypothetical protein ACK4WD_04005, partial [Flavobacteriales bacterium]